jgi:GT2 family glycosyltransferase
VVLRNPVNTHVATASNIAMRMARGRYFARLDQDDIAVPERLRRQVDFLDRRADVAVCGGRMDNFGSQQGTSKLPAEDARIMAMLLPAVNGFANPTTMSRLEFIRRHAILSDPRFPLSCDYGMWVDCMFHGGAFANLQEVLTQ